MTPLQALRHHVTGAIERGEKIAIVGIPATKNANDWREECNYIDATTAGARHRLQRMRAHALRSFNGDRACFVRYCEMQRDDAERHGFHDAALYIQECIDDLTA